LIRPVQDVFDARLIETRLNRNTAQTATATGLEQLIDWDTLDLRLKRL
jgi:hypothetical protein